ncbi:MAG: hypothetical protein JXR65_06995 [Bacteroidales bacterium]|nr:hypothetical protein [Bacteroidales bacterium]
MTAKKSDPSMDELSKKLTLQAQLEEVRKLLTGYDRKELAELNRLLKDKDAFAEQISQLLPDAFNILVQNGTVTLETIQPMVEDVLKESIRKNPRTLSDILFPIMMPAIRKAVAEDIKRMLESVNNTLEHGFSPKRLGWRLQSIFSGKSYGEIVLSHAYIYQVKQVFLIHKETGLLLAQTGNDKSTDADLVSAMLTAIKDFVQDSFHSENDSLDSIQVGKLNIWIEQGPKALIAAIVEGNIPQNYRILLKENLEGIHIDYSYELEHFSGDTARFQNDEKLLDECIQQEKKPEKKRKPVAAILLLFLILGTLVYWIYSLVDQRIRFDSVVSGLKELPGVVVTETGKQNGVFYVCGLRDPLVKIPDKLFSKNKFAPDNILLKLKPYISLEPSVILKRVKKNITSETDIRYSYRNDTLFVSGEASRLWMTDAEKKSLLIPGISTVVFLNAPKTIRNFPIEHYLYIFAFNSDSIPQTEQLHFIDIVNQTRSMLNFNFDQDSVPVIVALSHTNIDGNKSGNKIIAQQRADKFINLMIQQGIPPEVLIPKVVVMKPNDTTYPLRSVTFKIEYAKSIKHD